MRWPANCKLGATVEHSVSSVLEASVSGWTCQGLLMSVLHNFLAEESFSHPFPAVAKPNP